MQTQYYVNYYYYYYYYYYINFIFLLCFACLCFTREETDSFDSDTNRMTVCHQHVAHCVLLFNSYKLSGIDYIILYGLALSSLSVLKLRLYVVKCLTE